jgi:hypothetical protein
MKIDPQSRNVQAVLIAQDYYNQDVTGDVFVTGGAPRTLLTIWLGPCINNLDDADRLDLVLEHGPATGPFVLVPQADVQMMLLPAAPERETFAVVDGVIATLRTPAVLPVIYQGFYNGDQPALRCRLVRVGRHALGAEVMATAVPIHNEPVVH